MNILLIGGNSLLSKYLKPVLSSFAKIYTAGRSECDFLLDLTSHDIVISENIDVVINTAAHFGGSSCTDFENAINTNVLGTIKSIDAAVSANVKHYIYISSIFSELEPISEFYTAYSLSKKHAEEAVALCCTQHSLPFTILKPSQFYSSDDSYRAHQPFFHQIIDKVKGNEHINLFGKNDPLRNFLHVDDFTKIIALVIQNNIIGKYACAFPENTSYTKIINAAIDAFSSKSTVTFITDKKDIPDNTCPIETNLYAKINFTPQISINEGMKKIARYEGTLTA